MRSPALFPLTPALCLREREDRIPSVENPTRNSLSKARPTVLPLPEAEGRGEGEQGRRAHRALKLQKRVKRRVKVLTAFAACGLILCPVERSHGAPCSYSLSPASASLSSAAGAGAFNVTAGSSCAWMATTTNSWIHTTSSGTNNGTVNYTVDANGGS